MSDDSWEEYGLAYFLSIDALKRFLSTAILQYGMNLFRYSQDRVFFATQQFDTVSAGRHLKIANHLVDKTIKEKVVRE